MKIILTAREQQEMGGRLEKLIHHQLPDIQIKTLTSVQQLSQALCRPLHRISVIIIFTMGEADIKDFLTLRPLFDNIRLILILPDRSTQMMTLGLQLNPCFVSDSDGDFSDIIAVLKKIGHRTNQTLDWQMRMNEGPY